MGSDKQKIEQSDIFYTGEETVIDIPDDAIIIRVEDLKDVKIVEE